MERELRARQEPDVRPEERPEHSQHTMTTNPTSSAAIEFRNAGFQAGKRPILRALTLRIDRGETCVLLGRSGSGKTTTLKLINRLLDASEGEVWVEGRQTRDWDPILLRRRIGYVIQEIGLFPHLTIGRNVGLVPELEAWPPAKIKARVRDLLARVGLDPAIASRYPNQLSGGQRQRVGVARALAADPPILLMDEPFGALDPITRAEIQQEFLRLQQAMNKTVVFVTHDLPEALLMGTRICLFDAGRLIGGYTPQSFLAARDPLALQYRAAFEGNPKWREGRA
jgi:osmoprotectant transport system ATP-binding protein